ncbi:7-deoxyloganetin glucosyltransferase-like [Telopea speciosissima]|uniref:7-deoxyloganetin glucosyltransferase-like n=1 Tax=Telopea speciosissima TaxID=54955 RepID=UPI001CC54EF2|nr:7-deoxyloganetin glucosyltransferase-like [Telopea speciosissima]
MERPVKPHIVCIPLPAQGHINPMLKLGKLLHLSGFHITFVHTEFNYHRLMKSTDPDPLKGFHGFRFETIPDGLPPSNNRGILDLPALCISMTRSCVDPFRDLIRKLNTESPITCILSDGVMGFTLQVAQEFGIPEFVFFTTSACGFLGYLHYEDLVQRGFFPLKDESCLNNGYLDTTIDWIEGMKGIRLKDLPTFLRTTDPDDVMFNYNLEMINNAFKTQGLILNTFDDLEAEFIDAIKSKFPKKLYTIGPLSMLLKQSVSSESKEDAEAELNSIESNLWREDRGCLEWLNERKPKSVVYVNFGSLAIITPQQLNEFAWGLANSRYDFLWVIRPDIVNGGSEIVSGEFMDEVRGRGLLSGWCPQEQVFRHPSIGGFLTHCGWNSTLESICEGVPMICWPFFAEQQTNCLYACTKWGIGMEIDSDVKREEVEGLVRELMEDGEKCKSFRLKAMEWKKKAEEAAKPGGSSYINFYQRLIPEVLGSRTD